VLSTLGLQDQIDEVCSLRKLQVECETAVVPASPPSQALALHYPLQVRRMGITTPERLLTLTASDLTVLGLDAVEQDTFRQELVVVLLARRRILQREAAQEAGGCDSEGRGNMPESQGRTHRARWHLFSWPCTPLCLSSGCEWGPC
jgi:hypothetical protein